MLRKFNVVLVITLLLLLAGCKISGKITENGVGVKGIEVRLAGNITLTTVTDADGYYEFSDSKINNRQYIITPLSEAYSFDPISKDVKVGSSDVADVAFRAVKGIIETYRKSISISPGSGAGTGYSIKIRVGQSASAKDYDVQLDGKGLPTFGDIRFTADDGTSLLGYWLEDISGTAPGLTATFWVKVKANLDSAQSIYIYYGNNNVLTSSNGKATFDFFDDFEKPFFPTSNGVLENASTFQITPTYDGSGQTVHPDIEYMPAGWHGYTYWMAMTPYPNTIDSYENPSILVSNDGVTWIVPPGLANPLIGKPSPCGHNNDTDIIYNKATDEMFVYHLDTRHSSECSSYAGQPYYNHNYLQLFKSSDGIHWTGPITLIDWDLNTDKFFLSPAIVQRDTDHFYMWLTDQKNGEVYWCESGNGINWSDPVKVNLPDIAWHLNVEYIPSRDEYWMIYVVYGTRNISWAVSKDGFNWTYFSKYILTPKAGAWDNSLYRSCFLYDEMTDLLEIWYSAYDSNGAWHTGYVNSDYSDLLGMLEASWTLYKTGGTGDTWSASTENVKRGSLSGKLVQKSINDYRVALKDLPEMTNFIAEWDMYDDLDDTAFKIVRINNGKPKPQTGIGVWTRNSTTNYAYHNSSYSYTATGVQRSAGWHKFGIKLSSNSTAEYFIDGLKVGSLSGLFDKCLSISVEGFTGGPTTFYVDDIRLRKTASVEPFVNTSGASEHGIWHLY